MDSRGKDLHYRNMNSIPTYALYGEQETTQDWLHWETIPARASKHDFRIAPHRHEHLFQLLALTKGTADITLDGTDFRLEGRGLVIVPALTVHGYAFSSDVDGIVLTLFQRDVRSENFSFNQASVIRTDIADAEEAMHRLISEADRPGRWHDLAMRSHLSLLLIALSRAQDSTEASDLKTDRVRAHASAFLDLVEKQFRHTRRLTDYAGQLGVTPTHLNRICRQALGTSALAVIERRIALEARRQLLFSTLSVKQIGAELGYDDPAYFTRFITRTLGMAPAKFRRQVSNS